MRFKIELEIDNAAFGPHDGFVDGAEISRILRRLADKIEDRRLSNCHDGPLVDLNGNGVGYWEVRE